MTRSWQCAAVAMVLLVLFGTPIVWTADRPAGDSLTVPEGSPEDLVAFIQQLMKQRPRDAEALTKTREAILKAAERILASKLNNEQLLFAVQAKAAMLQDPQELAAFEAKLKKTGAKAAARIVRRQLLLLQLEHAGNETVFLQQLDEVKKLLAAAPLQPGDEQLAMQAAEIAEGKVNNRLAGETYESMAKLLAAEPRYAGAVQQMQGCARRLKLVGNAMHLEGKTLDGKVLDWAKYRGKVVLIDFWATWCGPCRAEIPDIKDNYKKYQHQGFDVIGISLDQMSSEEIAEFVKKEEVPWTICRDADSPQNMAAYYGIRGIPEMILVGRDGKVIALGVRGPALGPLVEKAVGAAGYVARGGDDEDQAKLKKEEDPAKLKKEKEKERKKAEDLAALKEKREQAVLQANARQARTWTDASGKFHVTAKFRGMVSKVVKLELEDGSVISLPLEKLSDDDQECIRERKY